MFYYQNVLSFFLSLFCLCGPFSPSHLTLTWSLSPPESCLCSFGVPVRSSLFYLALSGLGPVIRSRPTVRARPTPEHQLVVKGEEGECVAMLVGLGMFCLSACPSQTNRLNLLVQYLETSEHWVVFSFRKQDSICVNVSH